MTLRLLNPSAANSEDNPYLIETTSQLYYLQRGLCTDENGTTIDSTGKYFRVADGIKAFCFSDEEVMSLTSAEDVKNFFVNTATKKYEWWSNKTFKGTFDGNGATVYGLYADGQGIFGLFPIVDGATIKNVTVKNCYASEQNASSQRGAIFGFGAYKTYNTITLENCASINNYLASDYRSGALGGETADNYIVINNCLAYGNDLTGHNYIVGYANTKGNSIKNTVAMGVLPHGSGNITLGQTTYDNVYTDQQVNKTGITVVDSKDITGIDAKNSMPALDWNDAKTNPDGVWYQGAIGEYPSFQKADNLLPAELKAYYDQLVSERVYDNYGVSTTEFGMFGTSLNLKVNPYISFTLAFNKKYKTNRANINVTFSAGNSSVTVNGDNMVNNVANGAGRYHMYRFKTITVEDLSQPITVTANYNGENYNFGTFTVGGFALDVENYYNILPCDYYKYCANAANALMFYAAAVNYRYGA